MTCVLDSSALLVIIKKETGSEKVEAVLSLKPEPLIHAINLFEVHYKVKQMFAEPLNRRTMAWLKKAPVTVVELLSPQITDYGRYLKSKHHLSLADSIGLGLAKFLDYPFLTADRRELELIAKTEKVKIEFLR